MGKRGFTLIEILLVMIITGITLPVVGTAFYMLLKVPAQETAKLAVLNDVNLALDWINKDVNRGQYFSGDPVMLKRFITVDFTMNASTDQQAWAQVDEPTSPMDRGNVCPSYPLINASDRYRWNYSAANQDGELNTQMFQFTVPDSVSNSNISPPFDTSYSLSSIAVSWKGNTSFNKSALRTSLMIWDYGTGSWKRLDREFGMIQEGWLTGRVMFSNTSPPWNYIQDRKIYFLVETPYHKDPGSKIKVTLCTNYIKLMLLMPIATTTELDTSKISYGGFSWVDKTRVPSISYNSRYYFLNTSKEPTRLMREEWRDNELVSTLTLAYHIQTYEDITFDYHPAGTGSSTDTLPYVVVTVNASTGLGEMFTRAFGETHFAFRSTTQSHGMAVLTSQGVGTGMDGILISGTKLLIDGSMRTMGNITIFGESIWVTGNLVNGPAEAGGNIVDNAGSIAESKRYQQIDPWAWDLKVTDFVANDSAPKSNEYIFPGDVDETELDDYWSNPPTNTVLKEGVYYSKNGNISLSRNSLSGIVTLVSPNGSVRVYSNNSCLSAFCNGVVLFSNASYNDSVELGGDGDAWAGNLYAPYGGVLISGTRTQPFTLFGSIAAQRFNYISQSSETFTIVY